MTTKTLIHLSDLHIGKSEKETNNTEFIFQKIADEFSGVPVLITGDLTQSATKSQFIKTRALLDGLAITNPGLVVPGNHDYAWNGIVYRPSAWANWVNELGSPLGWSTTRTDWLGVNQPPFGIDGLGTWEDGPCVYFGVDSGDPTDKVQTAVGYISDNLANGLKKSLKEYSGKTRIVFLHHHPFMHGKFMKLTGADIFLEALKDNCEILLFGHKHNYGIWWGKGSIPLIVASHKSPNYITGDCHAITVIDIKNAGTPNYSISHQLKVYQQ